MQLFEFLTLVNTDPITANLYSLSWFTQQQFPPLSVLRTLQQATNVDYGAIRQGFYHDTVHAAALAELHHLHAGYAALFMQQSTAYSDIHVVHSVTWILNAADRYSVPDARLLSILQAMKHAFADVPHPTGLQWDAIRLISSAFTLSRRDLSTIANVWSRQHPDAFFLTRLYARDVQFRSCDTPLEWKRCFVRWLFSVVDNVLDVEVDSMGLVDRWVSAVFENLGK